MRAEAVNGHARGTVTSARALVLVLRSQNNGHAIIGSLEHSGFWTFESTDLSECMKQLRGKKRPAAWVIDAERVDDDVVSGVQELYVSGLLSPTAVFFHRNDSDLFTRTWPLGRFGVTCAFAHTHLPQHLASIMNGESLQLMDYIAAKLSLSTPLTRRLLIVLATDRGSARV